MANHPDKSILLVEESLRQVLERWKKAFHLYKELKAASDVHVVRWEWTDGERYSLLPFYFYRFPGRARLLKEPPVSRGYYIRYGFDEQDRPIIHYYYKYNDRHAEKNLRRDHAHKFEQDDLSVTFYSYNDTLAEIIEYSVPPRIPLKVQQIFLDAGRVVRHVSLRLNGYTPLYSKKRKDPTALYNWLGRNGRFRLVEQYVYDQDRLTSILFYHEQPGAPALTVEERVSYDSTGKLLRIERHYEDGYQQLLYRAREKGQTFKSMRKIATQKLVEAIKERLRTENIREKLCCIELSYQAVIRQFPPSILLGRETDRNNLLASGDPQAKQYVLSPALMGGLHYLEISDPDTLEICSQLEHEIQSKKKWDIGTNILRDVAAELSRTDWHGILEVTPDFIVFAIDWEMHSLADALSTSASQDQIKEWKEKGWL